ncbi:MAG: c-type cytochrome [Rubrivivax sp.]|nr:c-type cytochrome [Rubrivivax sp.]MDH5340499.1 c-type cytochrome [Rubrivivax sp.]
MPRLLSIVAATVLAAITVPSWASPQLAQKYACTACHSVDKKIVGPAFADVAKKYAGTPDALATLMSNIKAGGGGKWGPVPMPAQAAVPDADLKALATWILGAAK